MAWSPLAGGALFGETAPALRLRPALARIAAEQGVAPDAVAIAWLLAHPANIMPIVGSNQPQRLARLADAFKVTIDRETWFELWAQACGHDVP
jgi:predicted oxidoreductase